MSITRTTTINPKYPNRATALFGGKSSGILNWNDLSSPKLYDLRERIRSTFWSYSDINITNDTPTTNNLGNIESFVSLLVNRAERANKLQNYLSDVSSDAAVKSIFATMLDQNYEHIHAMQNYTEHLNLQLSDKQSKEVKYYKPTTIEEVLQCIEMLIEIKYVHRKSIETINYIDGLNQIVAKVEEEYDLHTLFLKELHNEVSKENNLLTKYNTGYTIETNDKGGKIDFNDFDDL